MDNFESSNLQWNQVMGGGPPYFCEFSLQELNLVLIVYIREKSPYIFQQRKGKRNHFEIGQSILLFLVRPANRRNYFTYIGKGKYPTPDFSSSPVPLKGEKN